MAAAATTQAPTIQFTDPSIRDAARLTALIAQVNRANYGSTLEELRSRSASLEAFRFTANRLTLDILNKKDPEQYKLQLLQSFVASALDKPNFITMLADLLDAVPSTVQFKDVNELVVKHLRLKPRDCLAMSVALCYSSGSEAETFGTKIFALRMKEYEGKIQELGNILDEKRDELTQYVFLQGQADPAVKPLVDALRTAKRVPVTIPSETKPKELLQLASKGLSLAGLLEELGTPACATIDDCRALFSIFPSNLTPRRVAECMALFASASAPVTDAGYFKSLLRAVNHPRAQAPTPAAETLRTWNTSFFVAAVKELEPTLSWPACITALDYPSCRIDKFTTVSSIYKKATEQPLPVQLFIGRWDNAGVQGSALRWILANPSIVSPIEPSPTDLLVSFPPSQDLNVHWRSVGFLQSVIHAAGVDKDIENCLFQAMQKAPHLLFAGLLVCKEVPANQVIPYCLAILRESGTSVVTKQLVDLCQQEESLKLLLGLIAEFGEDPVRINEAMECYFKNGLLQKAFAVVKSPKMAAHIAIKAVAADVWPKTWFADSLDNDAVTKTWQFHKYTFAASIVEACDELLNQTPPQVSEGTTAALTAVSSCKFANVLSSVSSFAKQLKSSGDGATATFPEELEKEATEYLKRLYASDGSDAFLDKAILLYSSPKQSDKDLCQCIIHVLWQEASCVNEYPKKVLIIAAKLFGKFINARDVLPSARLQYGLRVVLQALMKPADGKILEFGIQALEQFKSRVTEWPQYCNALKGIPDLDMHVPGIMATITKGTSAAAAGKGSPVPSSSMSAATPAGGQPGSPATPNQGGMHQHDIRVLMGRNEGVAPPEVVQNRINFLVGNTDPQNINTTAAELKELLKVEYYMYFAEYLVVKRVSLEANHHRMYLQLIESIDTNSLFTRIRLATYDAIRRLLGSERIRANSSERTLLKNLGSWLGLLTLARNLPVLARDLDFKQLLVDGLKTGRLIAVVPLMAKILEQAGHSKIFRPPNPWLMSQLGHLMELYHLPDLKMTLRFEIEVLCKNLSVTFGEVPDTARLYTSNVSMSEIRRTLDTSNSTDFRAEESPTPAASGDRSNVEAESSKLKPTARPYMPREDLVASPQVAAPTSPQPQAVQVVPPRHQIRFTVDTVKFGSDVTTLPAGVRLPYRQALPLIIEKIAGDLGNALERSAMIAATTTKEIVVKDFVRDPDDLRMRRAAQQMARALSSSLLTVSIREVTRVALKKGLAASLTTYFQDPQYPLESIIEGIIKENIELVISYLVAEAADRASRKIEELLAPVVDERAKAKVMGEFPIIPPQQQQVAPIIAALPETLRPGPLSRPQLAVYGEFSPKGSEEVAVEEVMILLQQIEEAARRHYEMPNAVALSLTSSSFTEATHSEHHNTVKSKLLELAHTVTDHTALALAVHVFPRLMQLAESMSNPAQRNSLSSLLNEVCLFVLQSTREKNNADVVRELTKRYLEHPRCWAVKDVATNCLRLRLLDIAEFDRRLAAALKDELVAGGSRAIVEFAGHVVQKCLIEDKLINAKEMKSTLTMLEEIARARKALQQQQQAQQAAAPQPAAGAAHAEAAAGLSANLRRASAIRIPTLHGPEHRPQIKALLVDWLRICNQRFETPTGANAAPLTQEAQRAHSQQQSMAFVQRLQQEGWLKPEGGVLDKFLGLCTEIAVEDYATHALQLMKAGVDPAEIPALNAGINPEGRVVQPPAFRYKNDGKLFVTVDAYSELVVLLARCCGWNAGPKGDPATARATIQAESALMTKVLHVATKVLQHNHDYFVAVQKPAPPPLADDEALQEEFMQQPYVRFFSNVLIGLNPPQSLDSTTPPPLDLIHIIASMLHLNSPQRVPGFAFGWLELISHRVFISRILKNQQGWHTYSRVYCDALKFMDSFVSRPDGPAPTASFMLFFKSVLKISLVLLHDFCEFIITYHQPLCDAIPQSCIQLRNVILSAFPRNTRLPDPFQVNLKLDQMPEVSQSPPLADSVRDFLVTGHAVTREEILAYLRSKQPANFAQQLITKLKTAAGHWDVTLLNNVVLSLALHTLDQLALDRSVTLTETAAVDLFRQLAAQMDNQGRYLLISAFANQLRYPNNHTQFFSSVLLHLFECPQLPNQELVQEQIVRVLVERVLVIRPHPWGLLVTFIELVRNPKYNFWSKPFIRCTPAIEQTFEQVGRSIRASSTASQQAAAAAAAAPAVVAPTEPNMAPTRPS